MKKTIVITLFLLITSIGSVFAKILKVPSEYSSISLAITASADNDTILLEPGIYLGEIKIKNKNLL